MLKVRIGVWLLASMSFACLLGHLYGVWSMRLFACTVLPAATALLVWVAWRSRLEPRGVTNPYTWIVEGTVGGVVAAVAYDLFRLPFVLHGYPLFGVFPKFGQMLLGVTDTGPLVQLIGWAYHFSNGMALGIMYLAMVSRPSLRTLVWGGMAWACAVELFLLLTPYYTFFKLEMPYTTFLALTFSAHLVFGAALGWWCRQRLAATMAQSTSLY